MFQNPWFKKPECFYPNEGLDLSVLGEVSDTSSIDSPLAVVRIGLVASLVGSTVKASAEVIASSAEMVIL